MALFPAGTSFLIYYPRTPQSTNFIGGAGINSISAMREGLVTRLFAGGTPPSYPNGANPVVAVGGALPVPAMPVGYAAWGLRRITGFDWVEVADMVSIDPPMEKTGQAQATVLKSWQRGREYVPGFVDGDVVKCKAKYSEILYSFLGTSPSGAGDITVNGVAVPSGGLYLMTTLFAIVFPPNFGQGELTFGSQINFCASIQTKGVPTFSSEEDKVLELDFELKVTGPTINYPGA